MTGSLFVITPGETAQGFLSHDKSRSFRSRALVNVLLEIAKHVITCAHGKRDDGHGRGLVGRIRKNACVANVEIRNIVSLRPLVCNVLLRIISEPAHSSFVQAGSRAIRFGAGAPQLLAQL